MTLQSDKDVLN
jgi:protein KRI1